MSLQITSLNTTAASAPVAFSHAHTTSTANFATAKFATAKRFTKRTTWPTASKSAYYANFYAVDEATGALIE